MNRASTGSSRTCDLAAIDGMPCSRTDTTDVRVRLVGNPELGERVGCFLHAVRFLADYYGTMVAPILPGTSIAARQAAAGLREPGWPRLPREMAARAFRRMLPRVGDDQDQG